MREREREREDNILYTFAKDRKSNQVVLDDIYNYLFFVSFD